MSSPARSLPGCRAGHQQDVLVLLSWEQSLPLPAAERQPPQVPGTLSHVPFASPWLHPAPLGLMTRAGPCQSSCASCSSSHLGWISHWERSCCAGNLIDTFMPGHQRENEG